VTAPKKNIFLLRFSKSLACGTALCSRRMDAADALLAILTNGKVTEDEVGPHRDLLAEFPYLGPPHTP
jgi:hypothetical protein